MVFLSAILCVLWSIVFVSHLSSDTHVYAVLWGVYEKGLPSSCICMCTFPISRPVIWRVAVLGIGVCFHSVNLTLRALKGLRRAQWANMFSVLYSVPIEAFPVVWERPKESGGGPIMWRKEGEAVQSEPAFDPFCLMDEQPESAWTRTIIAPIPALDDTRLTVWEPYLGTLEMEIGCCGFPRPVHGAWDKQAELHSPSHEDRTLRDAADAPERLRTASFDTAFDPSLPMENCRNDAQSLSPESHKRAKKRPPELLDPTELSVAVEAAAPSSLGAEGFGTGGPEQGNGFAAGWNSPLDWPSISSRPTSKCYQTRLRDSADLFQLAGQHSAPSSAPPSGRPSPIAMQGAPTLFGRRFESLGSAFAATRLDEDIESSDDEAAKEADRGPFGD
eukprot:TRINITY_DN112246_c0_g1_i1.p1 TRINITY_DN112246_c0_g1~~TRINITY_DN112246_c0_g1_i1.p1  ORF type:complete len:419 (+),score=68.79 TRINITY_DN112246_c0_g1_i1:91-1257(+)